MFKGFKLLKRYYKLANLRNLTLCLQFILLLIPSLLSTISPVLTANIISALTVYDFSKAIYILSLDFLIVISSALFYFLYHIISRKINKTLFDNYHNYIYENVKKNKNINEINLPTITNITACIEFNKNFLYKLCFLIKSIITLAIIFYFNFIICLVIIAVSIISYLLLRITDRKIQLNTKNLSCLQQQSLDLLNSIHKGELIEENYNLSDMLKNKYFNLVADQTKTSNKISLFYSINNNFISLILKTTIFIATISLIGEIKSTTLTLSLYLILTPYLTSSAQNLISFFDLFTEFGYIENILNEFEALRFQEQPKSKLTFDFSDYQLYLYNISAKSNSASLKNVNVKFEFGKQFLIKSEQSSELGLLFNVLQRKEHLSSGTIFIDNKNVSDLPLQEYRKIIASTNREPFFFNISLIENLLIVCNNKKEIQKILSAIDLKNKINSLPQQENTIASEQLDKDFRFVLGLVRCYLSGAKIICIENLPYELSLEYNLIFKNLLEFLKGKCTLIIFESKHQIDFSVDKTFAIIKSNLKEV